MLLWPGLIVVGFVLLVYLLRNVLVKSSIEYFGAEQEVQVSCLAVEVNWQLDVMVSRLCLTTPNFTLALQDAVWTRSAKQVIVQNVQVKHLMPTSGNKPAVTSSDTNLIKLPENLPYIRIENISIESPLLADTLRFAAELGNANQYANQLTLQGDINASLLVQDNTIKAQLLWSLADVVQFFPAAAKYAEQYATLFNDKRLKAASIESVFSFDGQALASEHHMDFSASLDLNACQLGLTVRGPLAMNVSDPFSAQTAELDFSALNIALDLTQCEQRPQLMQDWQIDKFTLSLPRIVQLNITDLTIPEFNIRQLNNATAGSAAFDLLDFNYVFSSGQLKSDYRLELAQNLSPHADLTGQMQLTSSGNVSAILASTGSLSDLQWQISSQSQLQADAFVANQLKFASAGLAFIIKGDHLRGLVLDGNLLMQKVQQNDTTLALVKSQFELNITPTLQFAVELNNTLSDIKLAAPNMVNMESADAKLQLSGALKTLNTSDFLPEFFDINLVAQADISQVQATEFAVAKVSSQLSAEGEDLTQLRLSLRHQFSGLKNQQVQLSKLSGSLSGSVHNLQKIDFSGQTELAAINVNLNHKKITLGPLLLQHKGKSGFTLDSSNSEHEISLSQQPIAGVSQQGADINTDINLANIAELQKIITQIMPELELSQGQIKGTMHSKILAEQSAVTSSGNIHIEGIGGHYANTLFEGVSVVLPFKFNSAGLQFDKTTLHLNSLNAGVPIEDIEAALVYEQGTFKFDKVAGNMLGGQFIMRDLWLDERQQTFDVVLQDIDLTKIVALQNQPGIQVTGKIMGAIPVETQGTSVNVNDGRVASQSGGRLTILHNPAFDTIKQQQSKLAFLENYEFDQLNSKVTFTPDGWLYLDLAFVGQNTKEKQAVNFNYTHQENIFDLLHSLRIANGIQDKIEQNISQGAKQ